MKPETVADIVAAGSVLQVIIAWRRFKNTHDRKDAAVSCCEHTVHLFDTLDELERDVVAKVKA